MQKKYDIVAKTGEFQDRVTGETKGRWKNVGAMIEGDNGPFLMLDRSFNPAGLPNPENRNNCLLSLFTPKGQQDQGPPPAQQQPTQDHPGTAPQGGGSDDVPF